MFKWKKARKKYLGWSICFAFAFGIVYCSSLTVNAAEGDLVIAGTKQDSDSDCSGAGWSYVASTHTLTLDGFSYNYTGDATNTVVIDYTGAAAFTIQLKGNNIISGCEKGIKCGDWGANMPDISITGTGSIDIDANRGNANGIESLGKLTIENGTIKTKGVNFGITCYNTVVINGGDITSSAPECDGLNAYALKVSGGVLNASGEYTGIQIAPSGEDGVPYIEISGGKVTATATDGIGMYCGGSGKGNIQISDGIVNAEGTECGIWSNETFTIDGGTVTATGLEGISCGGQSQNIAKINGGTLIAKTTGTEEGNVAIFAHIKNAIAGKGFDNADGIGEGTNIASNTEGYDYCFSYRRIQFPAVIDTTVAVSGITLNKTTLDLTVGGSETLTATVAPADATDKTVTWSSSNQAVATVDGGKVTAVAAGTATITATAGGKSATCTVTVTPAPATGGDSGSSSTDNTTTTGQDATTKTDSPKAEGTAIKDTTSSAEYTVTSKAGEEAEVEYKGDTSNSKSATVPDTVTQDGVTYKVTSIAADAFKNNKTITSVNVGKNVEKIEDGAFSGCTKLKTATIGANVTEIGDNAFANCAALTKVTLPAKCNKFGKNVFKGTKKLKTLIIKSTKITAKTVSANAFKGISAKTTIKVPKKMKKTYTKLFRKKGLSKKVKIK